MENTLNISASSIYNKDFTATRQITFKSSLNVDMFQDLIAINGGEQELLDIYVKIFKKLFKQGLDNFSNRDAPNKNITIINNSNVKSKIIDNKIHYFIEEKIETIEK